MPKLTEYLKCDPPPARGRNSISSQRVTLAPTLAASDLPTVSYFHRALALRNYLTAEDKTFDDLTVDEQRRIREVARQLRAKDHPCAT